HTRSKRDWSSDVCSSDLGGWFWVGDGLQRRDGAIQLMALQYWDGGGGMWDFGWDSNHLATFDPDSFELLDLVDLPSASGVQWAKTGRSSGRARVKAAERR